MSVSQFAIPRKCEIPAGAYGVWQVPDLNVMIPVYSATNANAQKIIDDEQSATLRKWGVGRIIEDHLDSISMNHKGIWNVGEFKPDTVGFLVTAKTTYCYSVKFSCRAIRQNTCFMLDGVPQWPRYSTDIFCVSCTDGTAKEVYLASFKYTGKIPT
jgi:hypothetical protein